MSRTIAPPPLDVVEIFPELESVSRQAVCLHPRSGDPTSGESSLGGRLLWPMDECCQYQPNMIIVTAIV